MAWAYPDIRGWEIGIQLPSKSHCFLYSKKGKKVSLNIGLIRNFLQYVCFWWKRWDCGCNCSKKYKDLWKSFFLVTFSLQLGLCVMASSINKRAQKGELKENTKTLPPKKAVFIRILNLTTEDRLTRPPKSSSLNSPLNSSLPWLLYLLLLLTSHIEPTSRRLKAFCLPFPPK